MPKHIAFLKAINVGGHTVKMDDLKTLFVKMGFTNVETFIASGNVFFETKAKNIDSIKQKIEQGLEKALGYKVAAFIKTQKELREIADYKPFKESELNTKGNSLYIAFLDNTPSELLQKKVLEFSTGYDEFHFYKKEMYWLSRKKFSESEFSGKILEKTLNIETTIRNSTTIKKIVYKYFQ
ncbi:MAG: DUF1697 domain-containing protein [Ignavibacteriaceae bacterium]